MPEDFKTEAIWEDLAAPFPPDQVSQIPRGGTKLDYITAVSVQNRLDEVLGPDGWQDEYKVRWITDKTCAVECRLSIRYQPPGESLMGRWITKADVGEGESEDEIVKSAYSDALKRAARKFGVGRYLADKTAARQNQRQAPATTRNPQRDTPTKAERQQQERRQPPRSDNPNAARNVALTRFAEWLRDNHAMQIEEGFRVLGVADLDGLRESGVTLAQAKETINVHAAEATR